MLTTKDLLPKNNNGWKRYGCDTFVPETDDLLKSVGTPKRITAMFPNQNNRASKNRDLRGSIPVPINKNIQESFLLSKPDGFAQKPVDLGRRMQIV